MNIEKLPINFKDDIINEDVNEKRKYRMIQNDDGTVSFDDVTEYIQIGDSFGEKEVVETNNTVNKLIDTSKFYHIRDITLNGMKLIWYQESVNDVQASGHGYAWGSEVSVNSKIAPDTVITWNPNTAYRLYIDASSASYWKQEGGKYSIINAFLKNQNGADVKEFYVDTVKVTNDSFYLVIYNHSQNIITGYPITSFVALMALYRSDYDNEY